MTPCFSVSYNMRRLLFQNAFTGERQARVIQQPGKCHVHGLGRVPTLSFLLEISQSKSTSVQASRYHDSTSEKTEQGKMPAGGLNKEHSDRQIPK